MFCEVVAGSCLEATMVVASTCSACRVSLISRPQVLNPLWDWVTQRCDVPRRCEYKHDRNPFRCEGCGDETRTLAKDFRGLFSALESAHRPWRKILSVVSTAVRNRGSRETSAEETSEPFRLAPVQQIDSLARHSKSDDQETTRLSHRDGAK